MKFAWFIILLAPLLPTASYAISSGVALDQMVELLRSNPDDDALRTKLIRQAQQLKPAPQVPDEIIQRLTVAKAQLESAVEGSDSGSAVKDFQTIVAAVPWYAQAYLYLGKAQEKAGQSAAAMASYQFYLLAMLVDKDVAADTAAGLVFRDCSNCPEMVAIPGRSYAIGKYPVTFLEWDACLAGGGCNGERLDDRGFGRGTRPVIGASWIDAQAYIHWLSQKTGKVYRLPSEEEWEFAARAGTTSKYYWGEEIGENNANCLGCGVPWENRQTVPVGSFRPNALGLYDMLGNSWQWVEDCWEEDCVQHVLRGGGWDNPPQFLRIFERYSFNASRRVTSYGFRLARTLP
ncbi:MAG: formylglycine-generating enzyme family protein [Pseudomonadota bacterium]